MSWPVSAAGGAAVAGRQPLVYSLSRPRPSRDPHQRPAPSRPAPPRPAGSPLKVHRCLCGPAGPNLPR